MHVYCKRNSNNKPVKLKTSFNCQKRKEKTYIKTEFNKDISESFYSFYGDNYIDIFFTELLGLESWKEKSNYTHNRCIQGENNKRVLHRKKWMLQEEIQKQYVLH